MSTITITAADVNKLRTITGAGMMDCKKALVEAEGDFDLAIENLRKKGQKVAANRSDRESTEGAAIAVVNADKTAGVVITLNCETDFVGKNEGFVKLATELANQGIPINSEAYNSAMNSLDKAQGDQLNELSMQSVVQGINIGDVQRQARFNEI